MFDLQKYLDEELKQWETGLNESINQLFANFSSGDAEMQRILISIVADYLDGMAKIAAEQRNLLLADDQILN